MESISIYKIADLIVEMNTYGRTHSQAMPYLFSGNQAPDMIIHSHKEAVLKAYPHMDDDSAEYSGTSGNFYRQLLGFQGFQFHSSAVVLDGRAYLFSADSGTGKSTHTQLWLQEFGDRAYILNDDKPALRYVDGAWYAYGTPWSGKHDISVNTRVPVAGIAMLHRGENNTIIPFSGPEAIAQILKQCNRPRAMEYRIKLLELLDLLLREVPVWKLCCNMQPQAAHVSYEAMSSKIKEENQ